jgi:hypothetical protein
VIETFPSDTAQETFADGVRTPSMDWRVQHFDGTSLRDTGEARSELALVIANQIPGSLPIRCGFPKPLGYPGIGRRSCDSHMDDFARFQFDDEDEERTKEQIGDLKERTGPESFRMIAKKGQPGLPIGCSTRACFMYFWMVRLHIGMLGFTLSTPVESSPTINAPVNR